MNFLNVIKLALVAAFVSNGVSASDEVGIMASISPNKQRNISFAIDSRPATANLDVATNHPKSQHIYWFERKNCESYHATLELLSKTNGSLVNAADVTHLEGVLQNFSTHAKALNQPHNLVKGKKAYRGKGYELRLFVHYIDGTHQQFTAKNVHDVLKSQKDISYANLVLKLGTKGGLKKDWNYVRSNILPKHADFTRKIAHNLETHITIGNLFKYTKQQNHIVNGKVERKNGKSPFNTPFLCSLRYEMQMLVDTFLAVNNTIKWGQLQGICLDRLQITSKGANGHVDVLKEVRF